ncbi:MAG: hypothetical protein Fur0044_14560 [Anaerolineae bacterium]
MNTITYLQKQLANINTIFHSIADDLTEEEWVSRPALGQNMIGYTVWHIPRTQDTHVQTWIRGIPEVIHGDRWTHWRQLKQHGNGVGISLAEADYVARSIQRADVMEYADVVHQEISTWLTKLNESDLNILPNISQHLSAYPEYQTSGYVEEASGLFDQPIWSQLMRPCIGHIHRHLGELEIVKDIMRKGK